MQKDYCFLLKNSFFCFRKNLNRPSEMSLEKRCIIFSFNRVIRKVEICDINISGLIKMIAKSEALHCFVTRQFARSLDLLILPLNKLAQYYKCFRIASPAVRNYVDNGSLIMAPS